MASEARHTALAWLRRTLLWVAVLWIALCGLYLRAARGNPLTPCERTQALVAGDLAPCTGQLWSEQQSKRAVQCFSTTVPQLRSALKLCHVTGATRLEACQVETTARLGAFNACQLEIERLEAIEPPPRDVWESPWVWGPTGALIGAILTGVLVLSL